VAGDRVPLSLGDAELGDAGAGRRNLPGGGLRVGFRSRAIEGQPYMELRADGRFGEPDSASVAGDDAVDDGQSQPGAAAAAFAGGLQRGTCTFEIKATNALATGAVGVIIFNEGQPGRTARIG
jgi:hypothetical protein